MLLFQCWRSSHEKDGLEALREGGAAEEMSLGGKRKDGED